MCGVIARILIDDDFRQEVVVTFETKDIDRELEELDDA